jgi:isopenicillin N synthase-like dioxygenase
MCESAALGDIPTIDLAQSDDAIVPQIRAACRDVGFFKLVGHGISHAERAELYAASAQFFALPLAEKRKVHTSTNTYNRGWTPLGEQIFQPDKQTQGDTKEGFYMGREIDSTHTLAGTPLHGPNVWPSDEALPGFRRTMEGYFAHVAGIAMRLVRLLAMSLGLQPGALDDKFQEPIQVLRLLHYSDQLSAVDDKGEGVFACGEHTDWGVLTLLSTDETPGLQIRLKDGEWLTVTPQPDALIVNIGDQLERWTNGLYRSTPHRVLNTSGQERYSVPFFLEPSFHAVIECLPTCLQETGGVALFPPTTCGEWLLAKHKGTHAEFASDK